MEKEIDEVTDTEIDKLLENPEGNDASPSGKEEEMSPELKEEGSKYTDFIGKCMKTGKTMEQCALLWKKEKPETEKENEDIWSDFNEKKMEAEIDDMMKEKMAAPKMSAIVYAMKKAGISEEKIKESMEILRKKYPYPYPSASDDAGNPPERKEKEEAKPVKESEEIEKMKAEKKVLEEKIEHLSKPKRESEKKEPEKKDVLSEDQVYDTIIAGIRGDN